MSVTAPTQAPERSQAAVLPQVIVSTSPATGRILGEVPITDPGEMLAIMQRARTAQVTWEKTGLQARIQFIRQLRAAMYSNRQLMVDTLVAEVGRPAFEAWVEFWPSIEHVRYVAHIAGRTLKPRHEFVSLVPHRRFRVEQRPLGVVAVIAPWNFPLILSTVPIVEAMVGGNTVIYKPSEFSTQFGDVLAKVIYEAGIPRDVFQIVQGGGAVGAALIDAKPDKVVFTGSPATARKIASAAGQKLIPVTLELGGKDAAIVLEDADLDRTAVGLAWGGLFNAGQACLSIERLYARREIAEALAEKLAKVVTEHIRVGPGEVDGNTMGAITTEAQLKIIDSQVQEAVAQGARVLVGGKMVEDTVGRFYLPTVITNVTPTMRILTYETFGPVIAIVPVASDEEAIRLANDTPFGLTGSVWTRDQKRGMALARQMRVGHASVNDHIMSASAPNVPWGGSGDSGYGRTRGPEGLLEMTQSQVISTNRALTLPREFFWYPYTPLKQKLVLRAIDILYAGSWRAKLRALLPW